MKDLPGEPVFWTPPPPEIKLPSGEIHIWRVPLDRTGEELQDLFSLLSPDEQKRANRFLKEQHRDFFAVGRGRARQLLSLYTGEEALKIQFIYNPYGKPSLKDFPLLYFNLSHSQNLLLFAITTLGEIGIDIEFIRQDLDCMKLANRYFSPEELEELNLLPPSLRARGFFNGWSRKEAYIKARGKGLAIPLCDFSISLDPRAAPQIFRVEEGNLKDWTLHAFEAAEGFASAVIVKGNTPLYRYWKDPTEE